MLNCYFKVMALYMTYYNLFTLSNIENQSLQEMTLHTGCEYIIVK